MWGSSYISLEPFNPLNYHRWEDSPGHLKELVQQGMSQAEANAQVVAEHREEVLFDLFSRFLERGCEVAQDATGWYRMRK